MATRNQIRKATRSPVGTRLCLTPCDLDPGLDRAVDVPRTSISIPDRDEATDPTPLSAESDLKSSGLAIGVGNCRWKCGWNSNHVRRLGSDPVLADEIDDALDSVETLPMSHCGYWKSRHAMERVLCLGVRLKLVGVCDGETRAIDRKLYERRVLLNPCPDRL